MGSVEIRTRDELLGVGVRAAVYAIADDRALKVYNPDVPPSWAAFEARLTQTAATCGIRVPHDIEVTSVDGRPAIAMERVRGRSLWSPAPDERSELDALGHQLWEVQRDIATHRPSFAFPLLWDRLATKIGIAARTVAGVEVALELLGDRDVAAAEVICHGDLHPMNIIQADDGFVIIDWFDAARGPLIADVARTLVLLEADRRDSSRLLAVRDGYRTAITSSGLFDPEELERWVAIEWVARLAEGLDSDRVDMVRSKLRSLSDR